MPEEAADDGDDEDVDLLAQVDRAGRDLQVPPDGENPRQRRDEGTEREGEHPVKGDVVAQRAHARGLVPDPLEG